MIKAISCLLIISFIFMDIAWAFPDSIQLSASPNNKLAPQSFFAGNESPDRVYGKVIESIIEGNVIPRDRLTLDAVKAALAKRRNEPWFSANIGYTVHDHEVMISFASGYILRYYDPSSISREDQKKYDDQAKTGPGLPSAVQINPYLAKQLLRVKAIPTASIRPDVVVAEDFAAATAAKVAAAIAEYQRKIPGKVNVIFAQGDTMIGFLKKLASSPGIGWSRVNIIQIAEFKQLSSASAFSFKSYMQEYFIDFLPIDNRIPQENIYNIGELGVIKYKALLAGELKPHIAVLGLGLNGHIGYNEPKSNLSSFSSETRQVVLADETIGSEIVGNPLLKMKSRIGGKIVVYTVGMADIASADRIFLFANGSKKQQIVREALRGPVTPEVPASMLQTVAGKVTVVLDEAAAAGLSNGAAAPVVDKAAILREFEKAGFTIMLDKAESEFLKNIGVRYLGAVVDSDELQELLKDFPEDEKTINGPDDTERFERLLQMRILDSFTADNKKLKRFYEKMDQVFASEDTSYVIHETYRLFYKFARIYEFPFVRGEVDKRRELLQMFVLLHIRPPTSRIGSVMRSAIARRLMLDEIFLSRDPEVSEFAIATVIELCAMEGADGKYFLSQLNHLLEESKGLPRFAMGMMDVIVNLERGMPHMPKIADKDKEKFFAIAAKIIMGLVNEDLKKEGRYFTRKLLEYSHALIGAYEMRAPAAKKLCKDIEAALAAKEGAEAPKKPAGEKPEDPLTKAILHDLKNKLALLGYCDIITSTKVGTANKEAIADLAQVRGLGDLFERMRVITRDYADGRSDIEEAFLTLSWILPDLARLTDAIRARLNAGGYSWDSGVKEAAEILVSQTSAIVIPLMQGAVSWLDRAMIPTDTEDLIKEVVALAKQNKSLDEDITVEIGVHPDVKRAKGLATYRLIMRMAIEELLQHAANYSRSREGYSKSRKMVITASFFGAGELRVNMRISGASIPQQTLEKMFLQSYGEVSEKTTGRKSALPAVKEAIESVGGSIWANSTYNQGTRYSFTLPVDAPIDVVPRPVLSKHVMVAVSGLAGSGRRTISQWLAAKLGLCYINRGDLARAVTFEILKTQPGAAIDIEDEVAVTNFVRAFFSSGRLRYEGPALIMDGKDTSAPETAGGLALRDRIRLEIDRNKENDDIMHRVFSYGGVKKALDAFVWSQAREISSSGRYNGIIMKVTDPIVDQSVINIMLDAPPGIRAQRAKTEADRIEELDADTGKADLAKLFPGVLRIDTTALSHRVAEKALEYIISRLPSSEDRELLKHLASPVAAGKGSIKLEIASARAYLANHSYKEISHEHITLNDAGKARDFTMIGLFGKTTTGGISHLVIAVEEATGDLYVIKKLRTEEMEDHCAMVPEVMELTKGHDSIYKARLMSAGTGKWAGLEEATAVVYPYVWGYDFADYKKTIYKDKPLAEYSKELLDIVIRIADICEFLDKKGVPGIWDLRAENIVIGLDKKPVFIDYTHTTPYSVGSLEYMLYGSFEGVDMQGIGIEGLLKKLQFVPDPDLNSMILARLAEMHENVKARKKFDPVLKEYTEYRVKDFNDDLKAVRKLLDLEKVPYKSEPPDIEKPIPPEKSKPTERPKATVKLRAESVYKDYFETFFEFNMKLFVLLAKRMKAKRSSDTAGLEKNRIEIRECLAALKQEIAGFDERLARLPADIRMADIHKRAKEKFATAEAMISRNNEPAANAALVGALNVVSKAREDILRARLSSSRIRINVFKKDSKFVMRQQAYIKADDDARTLVPEYVEKPFDLRWQTGRSLDAQEDGMLEERQALSDYLAKIGKDQAAIDAGTALTADNVSYILSQMKGVLVEEKRLARIALSAAKELIELQEPAGVRHLLPVAAKYLGLRVEDIDRILHYLKAGRIDPFREIVTRDNEHLLRLTDEIEELLEKGSYKQAFRRAAILIKNEAKPYLAEPDLEGLDDLLGPILGNIRKLSRGVSADEEKSAKVRAAFWTNLVRKKLKASQLLNEFMETFREEYVKRRLEGAAQYLKEDTFVDLFESFIKTKQLIRGSPQAKSLQMLCYLAAFISMENKELFNAINTLRLMVEIDDISTILKVRRLQKVFKNKPSETIAALETFRTKLTIHDLSFEERKTLLKAMAKDLGLDEPGRFELAKAFAINKETLRKAFPAPQEKPAATPPADLADEFRKDPGTFFVKLYAAVKADPKILEIPYDKKLARLDHLHSLFELTADDMVFLKTLMEHYGYDYADFAYEDQFENLRGKDLPTLIDIDENVTPIAEHSYDEIRRVAEQFLQNANFEHTFRHIGRLFGTDIQYAIQGVNLNAEDAGFFKRFSGYGRQFACRVNICMTFLSQPMNDRMRGKVLKYAIDLIDEFRSIKNKDLSIEEAISRLEKYAPEKANKIRGDNGTFKDKAGLIKDFFQDLFSDQEESFIDVNESIMKRGDLANLNYGPTGFKVEYQLAGKLPGFKALGFKLSTVWLDLIMNSEAAKTAKTGPVTLSISTSLEKDPATGIQNIKLVFSDNATGIPKEVLPRIFEKGFTTKGDKGTGLGLYIIKEIVKSYGGTIEVESRHISEYPMVHGTAFTIRLPVSSGMEADKQGSQAGHRLEIEKVAIGDRTIPVVTKEELNPDLLAPQPVIIPKPEEASEIEGLAEQALDEGTVAVVTLAGGMSSRAGINHPKGMHPIMPISERSLFQARAEELLAIKKAHGKSIVWFIMTSDLTDLPTRKYFEENEYFGLGKENVIFFSQKGVPAFEPGTTDLAMKDKDTPLLVGGGTGEFYDSMRDAGLRTDGGRVSALKEAKQRGIKSFMLCNVDNPMPVVDPLVLGYHLKNGSHFTAVMVHKRDASEGLALTAIDTVTGKPFFVEYNQPAAEILKGRYGFELGSINRLVLSADLLESVVPPPYHRIKGKKASIFRDGKISEGLIDKFENLVQEVQDQAKKAINVYRNRDECFAAFKAPEGPDSPKAVAKALSDLAKKRIKFSGRDVSISWGSTVELAPAFALSPSDVAGKIGDGFEIAGNSELYLGGNNIKIGSNVKIDNAKLCVVFEDQLDGVFEIPDNTVIQPGSDIKIYVAKGEKTVYGLNNSLLADISRLFHDGLYGKEVRDERQILLSESLFMKGSDDSELVQIRLALAALIQGGNVAIMKPEEIRRAAINREVTKEKMAIVLSKEDFENKAIWGNSDREASLFSSVLILDDRMTGNNYLYLEGVIGLARAVMARNREAIKEYYRLITGAAIDDRILQLLKDDGQNNVAFAIKAILKFRPIRMIVDSEEFNKARISMENALIAA